MLRLTDLTTLLLNKLTDWPIISFNFFFLVGFSALTMDANANAVITYHGRILDSRHHPVERANVSFKIRVFSPNPSKCFLYEEVRIVNMTGSDGVFVIAIGDGLGSRTTADPGIPLEKIFSNDPNLTFNISNTPKLVCNSGSTYTPSPLHQRQLYVAFDDHSGVGEQELPAIQVGFIPFAVSAYNAQKIGSTPANAVLRLSSGHATPLSPAYFAELLHLIAGTSTQYSKAHQLNGSVLPSLTNGQVLGWNSGWTGMTSLTSENDPSVKAFAKTNLPAACAANEFLSPKSDGSGFNCVTASMAASKLTGTVAHEHLPVADGNSAGNESGILSDVAQAIKGVKTFINNIVVQGNLAIIGTLSTTGAAGFASTLSATGRIDANGGIKIGKPTICTGAEEGTQRYNSAIKNMEFCNGSSWTVIGATGGVNSLRSCATGNANDVMVPVGSWCVDKYEASVWSASDGSGTGFFTDSTISSDIDSRYPAGAAVPAECNRNGAGCTQYAVSKPNVIPSRGMTWYQASKFCANAGKVIIPDDVWQTAAIGTYDPGSGSGGTGGTSGGSGTNAAAAQCNINTNTSTWTNWIKTNSGVRATAKAGTTPGGTNACSSDYGVEDMVGNLWEWTSMSSIEAGSSTSFTQGKNNPSAGPFATADGTWNVNGSAYGCDSDGTTKGTCSWKDNTAAAALRGGTWNTGVQAGVNALYLSHSASLSTWTLGFRCARPR